MSHQIRHTISDIKARLASQERRLARMTTQHPEYLETRQSVESLLEELELIHFDFRESDRIRLAVFKH